MTKNFKRATNLGDYLQQRLRLEYSGCVVWLGVSCPKGYGRAFVGCKEGTRLPIRRPAHRVVYEMWKGPIPDKMQLDHLCRNRLCCNPDHLEPVTPLENTSRGLNARGRQRKFLCDNGHEPIPLAVGTRQRYCSVCSKITSKRRYERRKQQKAVSL